MIVQTTKNVVNTINAGVQHIAKIKQSPKAFEILSGALYSNKILAVVRELSCNAYDAHVANGNPEVPFEVKIPTPWDSSFYIKDFGTGLSEDQIYNLYMTYFESSKQDSNEFVGQLGLGSKTPFSYGSTFTVESRQDGIKKIYTCFKNEELCPAVALMDTAPTDEPNGLTVSLSVRQDDVYKFQTAAKYTYMYFSVMPTVVGLTSFASYPLEYAIDGGIWKVRESDSVYEGVRVVQGTVSYPVDLELLMETLGENVDYSVIESFKHIPLDMFVPIGDVDIAPSREALTYNKRTAQNLLNVIDEAYTHFNEYIQKELDKCTGLWDATIKFDQLVNSEGPMKRLTNLYEAAGKHFTYGNHVLHDTLGICKEDDWKPTTFHTVHVAGSSLKSQKLTINTPNLFPELGWFKLRATKELVVIVDTVSNSTVRNRLLRPFLSKYGSRVNRYSKALVIYPSVDKGVVNGAELKAFLKLLGNPPVLNVTELPVPDKAVRVGYTKPVDQLMIWSGFPDRKSYGSRWTFGPGCWENEQVDLSEGGFYVETVRWEIMEDGVNQTGMEAIISAAIGLNIIPTGTRIIGMNAKKIETVVRKGNWVNLFAHIRSEFAKLNVNNELVTSATAQATRDWALNNRSVSGIVSTWDPAYYTECNNPEFVDFFDNLIIAKSIRINTAGYVGTIMSNVNNAGVPVVKPYDIVVQLDAKWLSIMRNNQMLKFIQVCEAVQEPAGIQLIVASVTKS